jgi:hypothetical protein
VKAWHTRWLAGVGVALAVAGCVTVEGQADASEEDDDTTTTAGTSSSTSTSSTTSTTSTTAASTDETSGSTMSSAGFIAQPDCGAMCAVACDVTMQDCPDGEKCTGYPWMPGGCCIDATKCVSVIGDKQLGEFCTRADDNDDCARGLFCARSDGEKASDGPGVCIAFCGVDYSCAGLGIEDPECFIPGEGQLIVCRGDCDPFAPLCSPGFGCYQPWWGQFMCIETKLDGPGTDGAACERVQGCEPGLACVLGTLLADCAEEHCCTPICDASGDGSECTNMMESCVLHFDDVGHCGVP